MNINWQKGFCIGAFVGVVLVVLFSTFSIASCRKDIDYQINNGLYKEDPSRVYFYIGSIIGSCHPIITSEQKEYNDYRSSTIMNSLSLFILMQVWLTFLLALIFGFIGALIGYAFSSVEFSWDRDSYILLAVILLLVLYLLMPWLHYLFRNFDYQGESFYFEEAEEKNQINICDEIKSELFDNYGARYRCYANLAKKNQDYSMCDTIKNKFAKDDCYIEVAIKKKDKNVCDNLPYTDEYTQDAYLLLPSKRRCYTGIEYE